MLTEEDAFKIGFLARCADAGMTTDQTNALIKQAQEKIAVLGNMFTSGTNFLSKGFYNWALPFALLAPPAIGAGAGIALAKAQDVDEDEVEDAKQEQLLHAYHNAAEQAKQVKAVRDYRMLAPKTGRIFL